MRDVKEPPQSSLDFEAPPEIDAFGRYAAADPITDLDPLLRSLRYRIRVRLGAPRALRTDIVTRPSVAPPDEPSPLLSGAEARADSTSPARIDSRPEPAAPRPIGDAPATLSWVEFELQDDLGAVLSGAEYRIVLPDGSTREGKLGADGRARFEDIPDGECTLTFSDLGNAGGA